MAMEVLHLQALAAPWRSDIAAARPQVEAPKAVPARVLQFLAEDCCWQRYFKPSTNPIFEYASLDLNSTHGRLVVRLGATLKMETR
jgi:hypothetical protein